VLRDTSRPAEAAAALEAALCPSLFDVGNPLANGAIEPSWDQELAAK